MLPTTAALLRSCPLKTSHWQTGLLRENQTSRRETKMSGEDRMHSLMEKLEGKAPRVIFLATKIPYLNKTLSKTKRILNKFRSLNWELHVAYSTGPCLSFISTPLGFCIPLQSTRVRERPKAFTVSRTTRKVSFIRAALGGLAG